MTKKILTTLLFLNSLFIAGQEDGFEIFNTSINSKYAEFGVTYITNNQVLFASSKKNEDDKSFKKNRRRNNRQLFLELYKGEVNAEGDIITSTKFSKELNNKFFECDITFTPDFNSVYFIWNNYYDANSRKDSVKWKPLYLFKASIDENFELSNILPLPFNSDKYSLRSPNISPDGKKLYLISDMPGGYGDFDIYVVNIDENGNHSFPKNLGPKVNTDKAELFPFVDEFNTLYFSSYGHKGKGNLDIFESKFENGEYQEATNLPNPINSKFDDFAFVKKINSNTGYFTSNREGSIGDVDIYGVKINMQ